MGGRIIVVDDAPFMRRRLRDILEGAGHEVLGEGAEGGALLELYELHRPDVATLDLVMPGLGGLDALRELRKRHPEARVIVCSSLSDQGTLLRAIDLGARDFVVKPVDEAKLLESVSKALRAAPAPRGPTP